MDESPHFSSINARLDLSMGAAGNRLVSGVNYLCRSASIIFAGFSFPFFHSFVVVGGIVFIAGTHQSHHFFAQGALDAEHQHIKAG